MQIIMMKSAMRSYCKTFSGNLFCLLTNLISILFGSRKDIDFLRKMHLKKCSLYTTKTKEKEKKAR